MATMASITVKKLDNATDIVYDAVQGSGGDSSPAVWRQDTGANAALPVGLRATFKMMSKFNGPKTARQVTFEYVRPYSVLDTTTGLYISKDRTLFSGICTVPSNMPFTELAEGAAQCCHLLSSTLSKVSFGSGYAPT